MEMNNMSKIQDFIREDIKKHPELKKEYEQESHDFDVAISEKTLKVMDDSIANFKKGKVSAPVDLSDFEK